MKGKRYTTEDKIRILREADQGGKSIQDICREENLSVVGRSNENHRPILEAKKCSA